LKLVADENIERKTIELLRSEGHDVLSIRELNPGIDDKRVLTAGLTAGSLLLTEDKDFGELVFRQGLAHAGVLLIRLEGLDSAAKAALVVSAIKVNGEAIRDGFAVLTPRTFRLRNQVH
jgi:predicted nuclease of predicted toxin-antitoxin system